MKNNFRKLLVFAGVTVAFSAGAHASTISGSFTNLQGDHVLWSAAVDPSITLSQQICCTLPGNQGDGTIKNFVNVAFNTSFDANVGKQDGLKGFSANWSGPSADTFAIHFGGSGGGNELLLSLSGDTGTFSFSMTGTRFALSSLQGFGDGGSVSQTPLPATFPLFASGLAGLGLFSWWRKQKARALAAAA